MIKKKFKKGVCPKCQKVRILFPSKLFGVKDGWKCTKCGYFWIDRGEK